MSTMDWMTIGMVMGLLVPAQGQVPAPLPPGEGAPLSTETWELVSKIVLQVPEGVRFGASSQRFLKDGQFVQKLIGHGQIWLFGPDGSLQLEWSPPAGHASWSWPGIEKIVGDRIDVRQFLGWRGNGIGTFIGEQADALWFIPGYSQATWTQSRAYRLWRPDDSSDPVFRQLPGKHAVSAKGKIWAALQGGQIMMFGQAFRGIGPVLGGDGCALAVTPIADLAVDGNGKLVILEGSFPFLGCGLGGDNTSPFRIHLVGQDGRVTKTIGLPIGLRDVVAGLDVSGHRVMVDVYADVRVRGQLYVLDLDPLTWAHVKLPNQQLVSFAHGNARLFDGGRTLKAFDPREGAIWTFRQASK